MKRIGFLAVLLPLCLAGPAHAQGNNIPLTITGGEHDARNVPVCIPLSLPAVFAKQTEITVRLERGALDGQLTAPGILTESIPPSANGLVRRDLHLLLPEVKAKATINLTVLTNELRKINSRFFWTDPTKEQVELQYGQLYNPYAKRQPILRYMCRPYDDSSKEKRDLSYKVFHHLYDPENGRLVTNGGPTGLYPHHRGLMYGFNNITYGGKKVDTWHCTGDTHVSHEGFLKQEAGPVLGRHRVAIDWHGEKKEVFAREERELTVYHVPGGTLVEFASRLKTTAGKVRLAGDPQHAGFQFRAHNDVADKTKKETYYLRPDGKGKLGDTRNWDPKTKKGPVNLPWDAMSFVLDGQRYAVAYLNHPQNPGESRWSERDYGRFGCYFEYDLTEDRPLVVTYRVWLQRGEMTGDQVQALSRQFIAPPKVTVK